MGTIANLLGNPQSSLPVVMGCFSNLCSSVRGIGIEYFQTEACKEMLLNPKGVKEAQCRRLKLNIDDSSPTKYFTCPLFAPGKPCGYQESYSNFYTSICNCGRQMSKGIQPVEQVNVVDGCFSGPHTSFLITDNLKVEPNSSVLFFNLLKDLGYEEFDKLGEILVNVGPREVRTLLQFSFSSNAPLTDMFLRKQSSHHMGMNHKIPSQCVLENKDNAERHKVLTLSLVFSRQDMKIGYLECGSGFVDLLFSFLVVPLEYVWELCGWYSSNGCVGNLYKSFKGFSLKGKTGASNTKCEVPWYYKYQTQLLDVFAVSSPSVYYKLDPPIYTVSSFPLYDYKSFFQPVDPGTRFMRENSKFLVSDDLTVGPFSVTAAMCTLKKSQIGFDDVEAQEIQIGKAEAISLLKAAFTTSSALTTAFGGLLAKKKMKDEI